MNPFEYAAACGCEMPVPCGGGTTHGRDSYRKTRQSLGAHTCIFQDNRAVSSTHLVEAGPDAGRAGALVELGRRDGKECHEEAHGAGCACDVLSTAEWRFAKGCNVFIMAAVPLSQAVEELSTTLYDSDTTSAPYSGCTVNTQPSPLATRTHAPRTASTKKVESRAS